MGLATALISCTQFVSPVAAQGGTSVSGVTVTIDGPTSAAGAHSGFQVTFTTSATGGMSGAEDSEWYISFPSGTGINGDGSVEDLTTDENVGGVGTCNSTTLCGDIDSGATVNAGDTLQVDLNDQVLPAAGTGYTVSVSTTSDTVAATSTDSFSVVAAESVSAVSVTEEGPSDATGAHSGFQVTFTTSSTGGMNQADGGEWLITFPSGTGINGDGSVEDLTTGENVGGVGTCSSTTLCAGINVAINPGDTLQVDLNDQVLPAAGTGYTVSVSTSSDTSATSTNSFKVVASHPVSAVSVTENGPSDATGAHSGFQVTFTTSSTGGMNQADGGEWFITFPSGTGINGDGQVEDLTTGENVGGVGTCSSTTLCAGINVAINPGDTLQVNLYNQVLPAVGTGYTVSVSTASDKSATSTDSFSVVAAHSVEAVSVTEDGPTDATGAHSGFQVTFTTSPTGGMNQADGGEWFITFPAGTGVNGDGSVEDLTTGESVGGVGTCSSTTLCAGVNVAINPGDTLRVDLNDQVLPAVGTGYTVSVSTASDTSSTSADSFSVVAAHSVSAVSVTEDGPTDAAGARSQFQVTFKTSSTGGMNQADGGAWYITFPAGTGINGDGSVEDLTTGEDVGGVGTCNSTTLCAGINAAVNPGDTLQVDLYDQALPAAGTGYTVSVSTASDTSATSTNSFMVVAAQAVSNPQVSLNDDQQGAGGVSYSVTFTTSSTGGMNQQDSGEWYMTFPAGTGVSGSGSVEDLTTGQDVGGVGTCNSTTICGGINVAINPGDTLQVNANGITNPATVGNQILEISTSSDTIATDGAFATAQSASISGSVVDADNNPVDGAPVQACPNSGELCQLATTTSAGTFTIIGVGNGTYTVIAYPPSSASGAQSAPVSVTATVPDQVTGVNLQLTATVVMPPGTTLTSGGSTTDPGSVPRVNWGNPITYTATGCDGGYGEVFVTAVNTSTGQLQTNDYSLVETPVNSGDYVVQIPPLAPLHGSMSISYTISCPGQSPLVPAAGDPSGGTGVFISGSGFTGAPSVTFGGANATSFDVLSDNLILAYSPAGTGTVPVDVNLSNGSTAIIGNFTYFAVTGISPTSGSASGGSPVTITGTGFTSCATGVMFGLLPAVSFDVASDTEIKAVSPTGIGTVDVQVVGCFGSTLPTSATQFSFSGGPAGSGSINEGTGQDALESYADQVGVYVAGGGGGSSGTTNCMPDLVNGIQNAGSTLLGDLGPVGFLESTFAGAGGAVVAGVLLDDPATAIALIPIVITAWSIWQFTQQNQQPPGSSGGSCGYIDPSGTVIDTNGTPVNNAIVTILEQDVPPGGPFSAVPPSSGDIEPAVNPETTDSSGDFDWDALAGTYEVQGSASGCHAPGDSSQTDVTSPSFTLPPPAEGLVLTLQCTGLTPPTPTVTSLSTSVGNSAGGSVVEILGTGLSGATKVKFGTAKAKDLTDLSPDALAVVAPPGSSTVDVTVVTPGGRSSTSSADEYTYVTPSATKSSPVVTSVSPVVGPTSGGTDLTLTGKHLSSVTQVLIGGEPASAVKDISASEVEATVPTSIVAGSESVSVTGSNGQSVVTAADTFKYEDFSNPPLVTKIKHASGPASGGNNVVIKGENFIGATQVDFGTTEAPGFVVDSTGTQISVHAPAGSIGTVDITVARPSGTSAVTTRDEYIYTAGGGPGQYVWVSNTSQDEAE